MDISEISYQKIREMRQAMLCERELSTERIMLYTDSLLQTEGEPTAIRRAKALRHILTNMTAEIRPMEKLVGLVTDKNRGCSITLDMDPLPEKNPVKEQRAGTRGTIEIPDDIRKKLEPYNEYWKTHAFHVKTGRVTPVWFKELCNTMWGAGPGFGHLSLDYEIMLKRGAIGLINDINEELKKTPEDSESEVKRVNLEASKIALEALIELAERYSAIAESMAAKEPDAKRKQELVSIAAICRRVPAYPAVNFREAIQAVWFVKVGITMEAYDPGIGFMRLDKYLYPYYARDIECGSLSVDEAFELIAMLMIKSNEEGHPMSSQSRSVNITIGGVNNDGTDAVNELSYIVLIAEKAVALSNEDIIIRVSDTTPNDFLELACDVACSISKMKFVGDTLITEQLQRDGYPVEMAIDYCITGCKTGTVPGRSLDLPGGHMNTALMLELALRNGYSSVLKRQIGPKTGFAREFTSIEDIWAAFKTQVEFFLAAYIDTDNKWRELYAIDLPSPLHSVLNHGYIEKGVDVWSGLAAPYIRFDAACGAAPNVGDSMAVLSKLVFQEEKLTMNEMLEAMDRNFEGDSRLLKLIGEIPKYGNGDRFADSMTNRVFEIFYEVASSKPRFLNAKSNAAAVINTFNIDYGQRTGTLPDGRLAGEPLAEGGVSPYQGRNVSGVTSTFLSAASLNHMCLRNGSVLNMRFDPECVDTPAKLSKMALMIKTFFLSGGYLSQFNVLSNETLIAAQKNPKEYRDLLVRVTTYAAYFIDLPKEIQDDMINRTVYRSF